MHVTRASGRAATLAVRRRTGIGVLLVTLTVTGCGSATESASPPVAQATPALESVSPAATHAAESSAPAEPSLEAVPFSDSLPVNLEMREDCGLCGEAAWLHEVPVFRMYADGQVVFRERDAPSHVYRTARLDEAQMEELVRYSLRDGGLEDARERYESDGDDLPGITFDLHAMWIDEDAERTVQVWPFHGETPDRAIRARARHAGRHARRLRSVACRAGRREPPIRATCVHRRPDQRFECDACRMAVGGHHAGRLRAGELVGHEHRAHLARPGARGGGR